MVSDGENMVSNGEYMYMHFHVYIDVLIIQL